MYLYYHKAPTVPRAGVVTTKGLDATFMPQFKDSGSTTVQLKLEEIGSKKILISPFYLGYKSEEEIPGKMIKSIIKYSEENTIPLVMGGDTNAHHII